jgi:hypothetical protein
MAHGGQVIQPTLTIHNSKKLAPALTGPVGNSTALPTPPNTYVGGKTRLRGKAGAWWHRLCRGGV